MGEHERDTFTNKDFKIGTYVLRDDTEIRKDADITPSEANSLFNVMTGKRMEVFAGSKD